jgi:hypothetical protein
MIINYIIGLVGWTIEVIIIIVRILPVLLQANQKEWMEDKIGTITLKLSYVNVFQWCNRYFILLVLSVIVSFSIIMGWFLFSRNIFSMDGNLYMVIGIFGLLVSSAISTVFRTRNVIKRSFENLCGFNGKGNNYSFNLFLKCIMSIFKSLAIWLLLSLFIVFITIYYGVPIPKLPTIVSILINFAFPFAILFLGCFLSFAIMAIIIPLIAWFLRFIIRCLEVFGWKIIKFENGAFTAIIMIIPAILGIINSCWHLFSSF